MILADLSELKTILGIDPDNPRYDARLMFYIDYASGLIAEWIDRPGLLLKSRTEYYNGTDTQKLCLRSRPVYVTPNPRVWTDDSGCWGQASGSFDTTTELTFGTDFGLWALDGEKSRSGILVRLNDTWARPNVRRIGLLAPYKGEAFGTIKVTYTGGYSYDDLPAGLRTGANILVARFRSFFPLALEVNSESYEERNLGFSVEQKNWLLSQVKDKIWPYRNWKF